MLDLPRITQQYLDRFPDEAERLADVLEFVNTHEDADLFDRKNPIGHITGSAFIVDSSGSTMLLLKHKFLDRWLQPGGHVDFGETPLQAAIRETEEEVGIEMPDLELVAQPGAMLMPIDIDSHFIPANDRKREGTHYHHDFRYLFLYTGDGNLSLNETEATGQRWVPLAELVIDPEWERVARKVIKSVIA